MQALVLRQIRKWWQSPDCVLPNTANRSEMKNDFLKHRNHFQSRYKDEVTMIYQQIKEMNGKVVFEWDIFYIIKLTFLLHEISHAGLANIKSFPDLQDRIMEACGICEWQWP